MNKRLIINVMTSVQFLIGDLEKELREHGKTIYADELDNAYWTIVEVKNAICDE